MSLATWPMPFVGSHLLLSEPKPADGDWDAWPSDWDAIRFDAIDVLFVSPFRVMDSDCTFDLQQIDGGSLLGRFEMVIRAARTKNPNIKIVLEQFYTDTDPTDHDFYLLTGDKAITYANSVAAFLQKYYKSNLESFPPGSDPVCGTIDGWEADVEASTLVDWLTDILLAIRTSLDNLSATLSAPRFSVSICPAWTGGLNDQTAKAIDFLDMQNYSGGADTFPDDYMNAASGLQISRLAWGLCTERPARNTSECQTFDGAKAKALNAKNTGTGIWTWRINSDDHDFENEYQVWLYNTVHNTQLPDSKPESDVRADWLKWYNAGG